MAGFEGCYYINKLISIKMKKGYDIDIKKNIIII